MVTLHPGTLVHSLQQLMNVSLFMLISPAWIISWWIKNLLWDENGKMPANKSDWLVCISLFCNAPLLHWFSEACVIFVQRKDRQLCTSPKAFLMLDHFCPICLSMCFLQWSFELLFALPTCRNDVHKWHLCVWSLGTVGVCQHMAWSFPNDDSAGWHRLWHCSFCGCCSQKQKGTSHWDPKGTETSVCATLSIQCEKRIALGWCTHSNRHPKDWFCRLDDMYAAPHSQLKMLFSSHQEECQIERHLPHSSQVFQRMNAKCCVWMDWCASATFPEKCLILHCANHCKWMQWNHQNISVDWPASWESAIQSWLVWTQVSDLSKVSSPVNLHWLGVENKKGMQRYLMSTAISFLVNPVHWYASCSNKDAIVHFVLFGMLGTSQLIAAILHRLSVLLMQLWMLNLIFCWCSNDTLQWCNSSLWKCNCASKVMQKPSLFAHSSNIVWITMCKGSALTNHCYVMLLWRINRLMMLHESLSKAAKLQAFKASHWCFQFMQWHGNLIPISQWGSLWLLFSFSMQGFLAFWLWQSIAVLVTWR